jgi:enoyl-CoA hydratase/carnithine racemase
MAFERIEYTTEDGVARLTMNQPARRNPLNNEMISEMTRAVRAAQADPTVRVVVLTGAGEAFSAGADLKAFSESLERPAPQLWDEGKPLIDLFVAMAELGKPIVAAVNGPALAGGCGVVAACDMAIASDRARLGVTEVRIGLFPYVIVPALVRAVGPRKTLELGLTGDILDAEEARRIGLVNQVVPHDRLEEATGALATKLASFSPMAIRFGRDAFYAMLDMEYRQAMEYARTLRVPALLTEDLREGTTAFLEKRKPVWRGR